MQLPKDVWIGGELYDVRLVKQIPFDVDGIPRDELEGYCCTETQTIYVVRGLTLLATWAAFWHEVLHAAEFEYEIDIPHEVVYDLDTPLARFFLDNMAG
jgi:hypothetical protein